MSTYIILRRLLPEVFLNTEEFQDLAEVVSSKIKENCPGIKWKDSFMTTGRFEVVDVVESDDLKLVEKAAMIIRAYGKSSTETLLATPWKEFMERI